ncbi:MAG: zinc-binding dehydrogenase [Pseudomonadota bacterium]|nr:zinc-binding dehydrogenase [Pseudomonadota bacterium]
MKAMVLEAANSQFVKMDVPDPVAGPGEAVAKILSCGSGLTIQHIKMGRTPATFPRIIGHEIAGEIVEVGTGVEGLKVADPVTIHFYLFCGYCRKCLSGFEPLCEKNQGLVGTHLDGGYAEYLKLPARNFIRLPEGLDSKKDAPQIGVVTDALATPYKVIKRAQIKPGETVAIFGAGGGLGIHQIMLAKWAGARVIAVDTDTDKFGACVGAGADETLDPKNIDIVEALHDLTRGGVDVSIDYVSSTSTIEASIKALGPHGRMVTLGGAGEDFKANAKTLLLQEQSILGSRYVTRSEIIETLELCARREIWPLVTVVKPLDEAEELHELLEKGKVTGRAAIKISE